MQELERWYWEHGVNRGYGQSDPDRELRKISIGGWLDPIMRIVERNQVIQANSRKKACLALWGPSQAGKSTMMSRYIDGSSNDGSDSALTWTESRKTRFSPPSIGVDSLRLLYPDTLIFNPFNQKSDASGIATRYTMKSKDDDSVNHDYPIEIKFTTRSQIIQSIALGYLSECDSVDEKRLYTKEDFRKEILESNTSANVGAPIREAYLLLKDIANVIECMKGLDRFENLFKNNEWNNSLRKSLVSSPELLASKDTVEKFMENLFWDSAPVLTDFYRKATQKLDMLQMEWNGCRIYATMEVGALLLDIDSYKSYLSADSANANAEQVKDKISRISYRREGNIIFIELDKGNTKISGDEFGFFQAICAELEVPFQEEQLQNDPLNDKSSFIALAEKCDFLDFPGVSNKNSGNVTAEAAKIDLKKVSPVDIFTKVFKQGKTQCFVYNYAQKFGIDAFAILVRSDLYPSNASILNAGIHEWLCSFDPTWTYGKHAPMPVFVNMTFFAALLNNVALNGAGNGLKPIVDRIQEQLSFAKKESATFFATTYHQFHEGKIDDKNKREQTICAIMDDPVFSKATGLTEVNIRAVYDENGGLDYMFGSMVDCIDCFRRKEHCRSILQKDKMDLNRLILSQLPSEDETASDIIKGKLVQCKETLESNLNTIENEDDASKYRNLSENLKQLFSASNQIFDPMPRNAVDLSKKQIKAFVKTQIAKWYDYKIAELTENPWFSLEQQQIILMALRNSMDEESLFQLIKNRLGQIDTKVMAEAARFPFALAFDNLLQNGTINLVSDSSVGEHNPGILDQYIQSVIDKDSSRHGSPYYNVIIKKVLQRLDCLSESCNAGGRPPQDGDNELKEIFDRIETSQYFEII